MRIEGVAYGLPANLRSRKAPDSPVSASRALVPTPRPLAEPARGDIRDGGRPHAAFIAHLIAVSEGAPQTRRLRRDTPAVAAARYVATDAARPLRGARVVLSV